MPSRHGEKVDRFYHSTAWKKARASFIQQKNGICDVCGKRGNLVHHIKPMNEENVDDPEIALNFDNYQLLCIECHNRIHGDIDSGIADRPTVVKFDKDGNAIVLEKDNRKGNQNENNGKEMGWTPQGRRP